MERTCYTHGVTESCHGDVSRRHGSIGVRSAGVGSTMGRLAPRVAKRVDLAKPMSENRRMLPDAMNTIRLDADYMLENHSKQESRVATDVDLTASACPCVDSCLS